MYCYASQDNWLEDPKWQVKALLVRNPVASKEDQELLSIIPKVKGDAVWPAGACWWQCSLYLKKRSLLAYIACIEKTLPFKRDWFLFLCVCACMSMRSVSVPSKSVGLVGTEVPVWTVTILYSLYDNGRVGVWSILPQQYWILGLLWDWLRNNSCVSGLQSRRRKDGRFTWDYIQNKKGRTKSWGERLRHGGIV